MFRKMMTVSAAICMAALLLTNLTGCMFIPSWKKVDVRHDASEIVSVDLYHLTNRYEGRFGSSEIDQMEEDLDPIDSLDAEQYADFVSDLENLTLTNHTLIVLAAMDKFHSYEGYTVKITYQNGDYDILSPTAQLYISGEASSETGWDCDEEKWNRFIKDYFTVDNAEKPTTETIP